MQNSALRYAPNDNEHNYQNKYAKTILIITNNNYY